MSPELCGGGVISGYCDLQESAPLTDGLPAEDEFVVPRTVFLVITAVLCALTKISVWAHGLTYLDDHEPESGPYFYGK